EPRQQVAGPVVVLFGPGPPEPPGELPVAPPRGAGAGALAVTPSGRPARINEPVTGTRSRMVVDTRAWLTPAVAYCGVLYGARGEGGKAWVSIGQREGFSWRDLTRLPGWIRDVRGFPEVSGWPAWAWISAATLLAVVSLVAGWL